MKRLLFILMLLSSVTYVFSQSKPMRVEFEISSLEDDYYIIPLSKSGLLLFYEGESEKGIKEWTFKKYDTDFNEDWVKNEDLKYSMEFVNYQVNPNSNKVFLLFSVVSTSQIGKNKDYMIITIDYKSESITKAVSNSPVAFDILDYSMAGNSAFIGGVSLYSTLQSCLYSACLGYIDLLTGKRTMPKVATMIYMDLKDESTNIIPYMMKGESRVVDLMPDKSGKYIDAIIRNIYKNVNTTRIERYDESGKKISEIEIDPESRNTSILSAKISEIDKDNTIVIGTYEKFKKTPTFDAMANGLYFSILKDNEFKEFKTYNFADIKSFTSYLSARKQSKIQKASDKANKKGKELLLNFNLLIHEPIIQDKEYIIITEAYYPEYEQRCTTTWVNGQAQTTCYYVFVGWRFTHAVIMGFDKDGNLLWDNIFEIQNVLTFDLSEKIKVMFNDDEIVLIYSFGGYLNSKIIEAGKVVEGKRKTKIETNYKEDVVKSSGGSSIEYWYDNYFLAYGYQRIKDKSAGSKNSKSAGAQKKRTVFYFNKIEVE